MSKPTQPSQGRISGTFLAPLFSPKGAIEGALLDVDGDVVQLTVSKDQPDLCRLLLGVNVRQKLAVEVSPMPPSSKGKASHAVRALERVVATDEAHLDDALASTRCLFHGKVVRIHFARHGEANGVVLDSGDFIHLKPEGFKGANLSVGDVVEAAGHAAPLVTGTGFVVEAEVVNGISVAAKPKKKPSH